MPTTQYIGARYVPAFADPVEWSSGRAFEPLTIVTYQSNSYTSKKPVPANIGNPASNPEYWAATGVYNQQVEQYRQEVEDLADDLDDLATSTAADIAALEASTTQQINALDTSTTTRINAAQTAANNAQTAANNAQTAANNAQATANTITNFTWERIQGKTIGIFGASQERDLSWCWPGQFRTLVGSHATVNVYGISGAKWTSIIDSVASHVADCDILLINTSANDATSGITPGGVGDSAASPLYWGGYQHLHDIIEEYPNKEFYVIGTNSKALSRRAGFKFPISMYENLDVQGARHAGAFYIGGEYLFGNLNDETNRVPLTDGGDGLHLTTPYTTYKARRLLRILLAGIPFVGPSGYYETCYDDQAKTLFVPNTEVITPAGFTVTATPDKIILMGKITFNAATSSPVSIFTADAQFDKVFYPQAQRMIPLTLELNHSPYTHVDCHYNFYTRGVVVSGNTVANDYGFYGEIPLRVINYMPQ